MPHICSLILANSCSSQSAGLSSPVPPLRTLQTKFQVFLCTADLMLSCSSQEFWRGGYLTSSRPVGQTNARTELGPEPVNPRLPGWVKRDPGWNSGVGSELWVTLGDPLLWPTYCLCASSTHRMESPLRKLRAVHEGKAPPCLGAPILADGSEGLVAVTSRHGYPDRRKPVVAQWPVGQLHARHAVVGDRVTATR